MCYLAQIWQSYQKYVRVWGADISLNAFFCLYWDRHQGFPAHLTKAMDASFADPQTDDERKIKALIDAYDAQQVTKLDKACSNRPSASRTPSAMASSSRRKPRLSPKVLGAITRNPS